MSRDNPRISLYALPGDFVMLILLRHTGVWYEHQCGGYANEVCSAEGVLVPFGHGPAVDGARGGPLARRLGAITRDAGELTPEMATEIDTLLASSPSVSAARVDRERLAFSKEGWVHVRIDRTHPGLDDFVPCTGVLVWPNSD